MRQDYLRRMTMADGAWLLALYFVFL